MELTEHAYRVLLVSASPKMNDALLPLLSGCRCEPVLQAADAASARRMLLEAAFDVVIINTPMPDEFGSRLALDIVTGSGSGVMLLTKAEHFPDISAKLTPLGVLVLSKPTSPAVVTQTLTLLCATRERLRRMEQKTATMEEKMEEIRLVNRAKWLLVEQLKMSEPDAHRYIQKAAMDRGLSRRQVAESIIRMYS